MEQRTESPQWRTRTLVLVGLCLIALQGCSAPQDDTADDTSRRSTARSQESDSPPQSDEQGSGGGANELPVMASRFTEWPFTVSAGTLRCHSGSEVTFEAPDGTEYAVNGTAKGAGYPPIDPIWADDEDLGNGLKVDISEVLAKGASLC